MVSCIEDTKLVYLGYTKPFSSSGSTVAVYPHYWPREFHYPIGMSFVGEEKRPSPDLIVPKINDHEPMCYIKVREEKTHNHCLVEDPNQGVFCTEGYVSECDIEDAKNIMRGVTERNLRQMVEGMCEGNFDRHKFERRFAPLMSREVLKEIESVGETSFDEPLGGWQMFKPTKGLDTAPTCYQTVHKGGGWYDIISPETCDTVSVRTMYAGKFLNPIVMEVRNPKMNVVVCGTDCRRVAGRKMLACDKYENEFMYLRFLCPFVHKESLLGKFVTEEDFDRLKDKVNGRKLAFVKEFYRFLLESGNDMRKTRRKYRYSMARRFAGMVDSLVARGKDCGVGMFLPCGYGEFAAGGYTVTCLGEDWYQVTAGGKSLKLKVVLYGKRLTPAIMGMRNPVRNIDYCPERFTWLDSM